MSTIHPINEPQDPRRFGEGEGLSKIEEEGDRVKDLSLNPSQTSTFSKKTTIYSFLQGGARGVALSVSQLFQKQKIACEAPPSSHESLKVVDSTASFSTAASLPSLHEIHQAIISCKTTIPLKPQKTVSETLEVFQDKAEKLIMPEDTLDLLKVRLDNPLEEKNYPKLEEKISTLEKLQDLEVLAWAENEIERAGREELDTPLPFELTYESLNNGVIEQSDVPPKDLIDKAKNSVVKLNNIGLVQKKQDLLEECHALKEESAKETKRLMGKSNSVAKGKDTAFKVVYSKYLELQKAFLEKKSEKLESVISALQEHSLNEEDQALLKTVHKKVEIATNENWSSFCSTLQALPAKAKKDLIYKINLSSCDPHLKEVFKGILINPNGKDEISINHALAILNLSKELGVQFILDQTL